jgi:hypothetical protein
VLRVLSSATARTNEPQKQQADATTTRTIDSAVVTTNCRRLRSLLLREEDDIVVQSLLLQSCPVHRRQVIALCLLTCSFKFAYGEAAFLTCRTARAVRNDEDDKKNKLLLNLCSKGMLVAFGNDVVFLVVQSDSFD